MKKLCYLLLLLPLSAAADLEPSSYEFSCTMEDCSTTQQTAAFAEIKFFQIMQLDKNCPYNANNSVFAPYNWVGPSGANCNAEIGDTITIDVTATDYGACWRYFYTYTFTITDVFEINPPNADAIKVLTWDQTTIHESCTQFLHGCAGEAFTGW